jgi:hypothetical protein
MDAIKTLEQDAGSRLIVAPALPHVTCRHAACGNIRITKRKYNDDYMLASLLGNGEGGCVFFHETRHHAGPPICVNSGDLMAAPLRRIYGLILVSPYPHGRCNWAEVKRARPDCRGQTCSLHRVVIPV